MGKANKSKPSQGRPGKSCKRADMKSIDKVKFRVKKGNVKQKQGRSVTRSDYQKKKLQNQQFESIKSLNTKSDQIQDAIRSSAVATDFERLKAPEHRPADINQAIDAINSL